MWSTSNRYGDRSSSRSRDNWTFAGSRSEAPAGAGFRARLFPPSPHRPPNMGGELCSDPRAEVVEALRWTRELLSRGDVAAADIGIVAASPRACAGHVWVWRS